MSSPIQEALLKGIFANTGRAAFSEVNLARIVMPTKAAAKQLEAFNLCDGNHSQSDVAKKLKLDSGNFSRTVARWIDAGILIRIGEGKDAKLFHIYSLSTDATKHV